MALYSNALSVVRQYLSGAVGDLIYGTADSGTTTTLVSTMLRKADDYYNEHHYRAYIYGGTNIGEEREVSDWTLTTPANTLTFDPAYSSAIDVTSKYELHHIFTEDEYRKAINLAIEDAALNGYLLDLIDETIVLVADTYEYTLPTTFYCVHRITIEATAATGEFYNEDVVDTRDWELISSRKLKLKKNRYSITAGKDLRLEGQGVQAVLTTDTDICYLPTDWVVQKAITFLPEVKVLSNKLDRTLAKAVDYVLRHPLASYPNSRAKKVAE